MKDNQTRKNPFRVSFSYAQTFNEIHPPEQTTTLQQQPAPHALLVAKKQRCSGHKITQKCAKSIANHNGEQQTPKKQSWGFEAITTRKQCSNKINKNNEQEADILTIKQRSPTRTDSSNEVAILKEQIKYMRNRLVEVQNAEKEIRLEFQLYKANQEVSSKSNTQSGGSIDLEQDAYKSEIFELKQKLKKQQMKRVDLQQRIAKQVSQKESILSSNHQLKQIILAKTQQMELMRQNLDELNLSLKYSDVQMIALKDNKQMQQDYLGKIQIISQENQRLNTLFQHEKQAKLFLQKQLKNKLKENESLLLRADEITNQLQIRLKDIDFLNQQSYQLDMSLANAYQEINDLKSLLIQNGVRIEGRLQINAAKQKTRLLQTKIIEIEAEIQKKNQAIESLKKQYCNFISQHKEQMSKMEQFKQKNEQLQKFLKMQNEQLKISKQKLQENQRILSKEVEFIVHERNLSVASLQQKHKEEIVDLVQKLEEIKYHRQCIQTNFNQEIASKNEQIAQLTAKCQELTRFYEQSFRKISQSIQLSQCQQSTIGHTLTSSELNTHLNHIKRSTQIDEYQNTQLREMLYMAKQELEVIKKSHYHQIQHLTLKFQNQLKSNNQQNNAQINFYIEEIERLMQEMDKFKISSRYLSNQVIEEESQEDNQTEQAQETVIQPTKQVGETNYMLQDIIDLDQKIHAYITNLNKRQEVS